MSPAKENKKSFIYLKKILLKTHDIKFNFIILKKGYLKVQLKDSNNNIINGYSFDDFKEIEELMDEFNYSISWKNNKTFNNKEIYIEIEGINFKIFAINNKLMHHELLKV